MKTSIFSQIPNICDVVMNKRHFIMLPKSVYNVLTLDVTSYDEQAFKIKYFVSSLWQRVGCFTLIAFSYLWVVLCLCSGFVF